MNKSVLFKISGWSFGTISFVIGMINLFWGNDPFFGAAIAACSFLYFPPTYEYFKGKTGFAIPMAVRIILGILILWAALGVGELFDKTAMMLNDIKHIRDLFVK